MKIAKRLCGLLRLLAAVSVLLTALLSLGGCAKEEIPEDALMVYYLNSSGDGLTGSPYEPLAASQDERIEELLKALTVVPADLDCQSAMPQRAERITYRVEENVLYIYMDSNYALMDSIREIFCRAALTKTLTQIEGVDYISIYSANQPIVDAAGTPVGLLQASDFVESVRDINSFERTSLVLYFANETGDALIPETREVMRDANTSLERLIVEQLIEGPQESGRLASIPSDVKILNIAVSDSVCSINFDAAFLNSIAGLSEYIPIYSIVDSLTELSTVSRVQIRINGSQDYRFWDKIPLDTVFERNYEYIVSE